jgi:hypothetical protein
MNAKKRIYLLYSIFDVFLEEKCSMKKIAKLLLVSIFILLISMEFTACTPTVEEDPFESIYGAYDFVEWKYENENSDVDDEAMRTDLEKKASGMSDEDYEEFKEIRDLVGTKLTLNKNTIVLSGKFNEPIAYRKSGDSIENLYLVINTKFKSDTSLELFFNRNYNYEPVRYYLDSIQIKHSGGKSTEDYFRFTFEYTRN